MFLFDYIGLKCGGKVVCLTGEVRGKMVIHAVLFERGIAQVGPQKGYHAQVVGVFEGSGYFSDLVVAGIRSEIDGGANCNGSHFKGLINGSERNLIMGVRVAEKFVVIEFEQKGDLVGVFSRHGSENSQSGTDHVATAFQSQFDDILRVEIQGIRRKGGSGRMFDSLVHRQDGYVARTGQTSRIEDCLHVAQYRNLAVGLADYAVHIIRSRKM